VFLTGSFWTSAVPMAAALACLAELERSDAIARMAKLGSQLRAGLERQAAAWHLEVCYSGPPAIPFLTFAADAGGFERSRTFAASCAARGVYLHPHHNWFLSAALTEADVGRVLEVSEEAFRQVAAC
jgi:glutamate-1-semialdehyde 2,1-aminomutase